MKKILARVEPERIIRVICERFGVEREEILRKGYRGGRPGRIDGDVISLWGDEPEGGWGVDGGGL